MAKVEKTWKECIEEYHFKCKDQQEEGIIITFEGGSTIEEIKEWLK